MSILMILGMVATGIGIFISGDQQQQVVRQQGQVVAQVGDFEITDSMVTNLTERQLSGMGARLDMLDPTVQVSFLGGTLQQLTNTGFMLQMADEMGVKLTDEQILSRVREDFQQNVQQLKMQLILNKRLKADATDKEFQDLIVKQEGKTTDQLLNQELEQTRQVLANPQLRVNVEAQYIGSFVADRIKKDLAATDEEVKKGFEKWKMKRVFFSSGNSDHEQRAQKALGEIKGGLPFDTAIDRYTNDVPQGGKKPSQQPLIEHIYGSGIDNDPYLAPLAKLKVGDVSEIIDVLGGKAIYKIISIDPNLPKDFEKNKAQHKSDYLESRARQELQKRLASAQKTGRIVWSSPVYRAMYELNSVGNLPPAEQTKRYEEVYDMLKGLEDGGQYGAALQFSVFDRLYQAATPERRKEMSKERLQVLANYAEQTGSAETYLELAAANAEAKNGEGVMEALLRAVDENLGVLDEQGQQVYNEINSRLARYQKDGVLTADQVKQVEEQQQAWAKAKVEEDKAREEQKKADEEANREAEKAAGGNSTGTGSKGGNSTGTRAKGK